MLTSSPDRAARAVQYLRMSTEHQRYSLENQTAAIAEYAALEGYEVVRTYSDAARSGLNLKGRRQLQQLLSDCLSPDRDFDAILVLDVSRWGRFQDPDQAAYYEYICRGAGVRVAYVGETFDNDGGLVSSIVKHLKRVMAAEYSRELSAKITRAKLQQARLGFRQGGPPGYGFRRQLLGDDGQTTRVLKAGQYKGVHTDRITTAYGPPEEQELIRRIFDLFIQLRSFRAVAARLNAEGVSTDTGARWEGKRIGFIIRNSLCIGQYTYNKRSRPLRQAPIARPPDQWVRVDVMAPMIDKRLFERANRLADGPRHRFSDRELLSALRRHRRRFGEITPKSVQDDPSMPHSATYYARFGSFAEACRRIGYAYQRRRWYPQIGFWSEAAIIAAVQRCLRERGKVSAAILNADPLLPCVHTVQRRFGGLTPCYEAAGLPITEAQLYWKRRDPIPRPLAPDGLKVGPVTQELLRSRSLKQASLNDPGSGAASAGPRRAPSPA
jgi:DNA invertase Pin-like site-specific DNA recombinase